MLRGAIQQLQSVRAEQDGRQSVRMNCNQCRSAVTYMFPDLFFAGGRTEDTEREHRRQWRHQRGIPSLYEAEDEARSGGFVA